MFQFFNKLQLPITIDFSKSNINVNAPLSSSIYSSPSYLYSTNTSSYHDQTLSIPSSPTINAANRQHPVLQSQDHRFLSLLSTETYRWEVKDSSTLVFFGGDQANCSSNSDGSYHYEYRSSVGVYDQHRNNLSDSYKEFSGHYDKEKGCYEDSSLDSSLEEIKQREREKEREGERESTVGGGGIFF
uniref:Uncharacterized protein n=1 Tax=Lactuca sativa TaxID=4236 RepID=A0A9R1V5F3_LACSA|nr:hypothetical protein LSAT_V11C600310480 [Lactuca sativa]